MTRLLNCRAVSILRHHVRDSDSDSRVNSCERCTPRSRTMIGICRSELSPEKKQIDPQGARRPQNRSGCRIHQVRKEVIKIPSMALAQMDVSRRKLEILVFAHRFHLRVDGQSNSAWSTTSSSFGNFREVEIDFAFTFLANSASCQACRQQ